MKRLFWVGVGVAVTVIAARQVAKVNGVARVISPGGIAGSIGALANSITTMTAQLRESMAEHEASLRANLLPSQESVANARARRLGAIDDAAIFDDEDTEYF
ncbi:MAG: hypothetical protein ACK5KU_07570 [Beutenbergiaceae bacterium]